MQPITDINAFLEGAKKDLEQQSVLSGQYNELTDSVKKLESALSTEKKNLSDTIDTTVKKRRNDIEKTYDEQIDTVQKDLNKVRNNRGKAKNQGIKERIKEETAPIKKENAQIEDEMKSTLKKDGVSSIFNNALLTLFYPQGLEDLLKIILFGLICFIAVPVIIYYAAGRKEIIYLITFFLGSIVVFGGLLVLYNSLVINKHKEAFKYVGTLRRRIRTNEKKINDIIISIKADKDDEKYNLSSFDDEISRLDVKLTDINTKKQDALNTFDTVTKNVIVDELTTNAMGKINELYDQLTVTRQRLNEVTDEKLKVERELSVDYEAYLGKEFMKPNKIDSLMEIINHGTATNISEAIEEYKKRTNI